MALRFKRDGEETRFIKVENSPKVDEEAQTNAVLRAFRDTSNNNPDDPGPGELCFRFEVRSLTQMLLRLCAFAFAFAFTTRARAHTQTDTGSHTHTHTGTPAHNSTAQYECVCRSTCLPGVVACLMMKPLDERRRARAAQTCLLTNPLSLPAFAFVAVRCGAARVVCVRACVSR